MSVNVERLSENSVKMTVEVSAEEFDQALDKAFEKVVKDVKADGFRPGKCQKQSLFKDMVGVLYIKMLYNLYLKVLIQKQ